MKDSTTETVHIDEELLSRLEQKVSAISFTPSFLPKEISLDVFFMPLDKFFSEPQLKILRDYGLYFFGQMLMFDEFEINSYQSIPGIVNAVKTFQNDFNLRSPEFTPYRMLYYAAVRKFRWQPVVVVFPKDEIMIMEDVAEYFDIQNLEITTSLMIKDAGYRALLEYRNDPVAYQYRMLHVFRFFHWLEENKGKIE